MTLIASPASALPIATGLTVNDSVMLSTPSGVKLMNGFSFFDFMTARNGVINVRDYGAKGDTITDDAPAIQAALDAAEIQHKAVYIPSAGARPNGLLSYYRCNSPLKLPDTVAVYGDGIRLTELRFTSDSNGIQLKEADSGTFTNYFGLSHMTIRGSADTSSDPTVTHGLFFQYPNYGFVHNVRVQDFVDGVTIDAGNVGAAFVHFSNMDVANLKLSNPVNGFPRNGLSLIGGTRKPQGIVWDKTCRVYAEEAVQANDVNGDGVTDTFDVTLVAPRELHRGNGFHVYLQDANGTNDKQVQGVDFNLFNMDSGSPVLINPSDTHVGAGDLRVVFTTPPPVGTNNVRFYWTDPTGMKGINIEAGSGNAFEGLVGGYDTLVDVQDSENEINLQYMQIARVGINVGPVNNVKAYVRERPAGSIWESMVVVDPGAENVILMDGAPGWRKKVKDGAQSGSGTTATVLTWPGDDYLELPVHNPGTHREVEVRLEAETTAGHVDIDLQYSHDQGVTWASLDQVTVEGVRRTAVLAGDDPTYLHPHRGTIPTPRYRVVATGNSGSAWTVHGNTTYKSRIRAREVNPN